MEASITLKSLAKKINNEIIIADLSLGIESNSTHALIGQNGAGKSTTLKVMTGYLRPTSGNVYVNDMDILHNTHEIQKQIGYLPELNPLYSEMLVYDLLEFHANIRNIFGKRFKQALTRVVDQCGLKGVIHKNVSECSVLVKK